MKIHWLTGRFGHFFWTISYRESSWTVIDLTSQGRKASHHRAARFVSWSIVVGRNCSQVLLVKLKQIRKEMLIGFVLRQKAFVLIIYAKRVMSLLHFHRKQVLFGFYSRMCNLSNFSQGSNFCTDYDKSQILEEI